MNENTTRTLNDIKYNFASLLYYELGHDNDYFPQNHKNNLNIYKYVSDALKDINSNSVSKQLTNTYGLTSNELKNMSNIMYHGDVANQNQKDTNASSIGNYFSNDSAVEMYSYSSKYEDTANLLRIFMLNYHYNIQQDVAFINMPAKDKANSCSNYQVSWGQRNTLAENDVKRRNLFVVKKC